MNNRYERQELFAPLGRAGQEKIRRAGAVVVGCGALGTNAVSILLRAGIGRLRIIDRDIVEFSNLHRQVLFTEADAHDGLPKATAAARHAAAVNSECVVDAIVADLAPRNVGALLSGVDLILDGSDNVETRYLVNDFAVKTGAPWIYAGAVGSTAACMTFVPGGPCLRCLWHDPPPPGSLPTCDTAGVLPSAPALAAALQAAAAMRLLAGHPPSDRMTQIDVWDGEAASVRVPKNSECVACGKSRFDFLDAKSTGAAASLCGRNAVQVSPPPDSPFDLEAAAARLGKIGRVERKGFYLEATIDGAALLVFPDGRVIVKHTSDPARARSLVSRYIGY
jgi:adenylyltransferase/sulfurtransferase